MAREDPVAVVICSRDRAHLLVESLRAVRTHLRDEDELVVVDSASRDETVQQVAADAGAVVVRCDVPGLGLARNVGWRRTTAPVVLFTDDDCLPQPGWRDAAVDALAAQRVGIVWGRVAADAAGGVELSTTDPSEPVEATLDSDLTQVGHGANMAFRRETLEHLGGFDAMLGVGSPLPSAEDKDAFWRALLAGWRVRLEPGMVVTHVQWRSDREAFAQMFRYGIGAGALAAKRRRLARERSVARAEIWRHGVLPIARSLRRGDVTPAVAAGARTAGFVAGIVRGRRLPLDGDVFSR